MKLVWLFPMLTVVLWGCSEMTAPAPTPTSPPATPTVAPTVTVARTPTPVPTRRPTPTPFVRKGLGLSAEDVRRVASAQGFLIETRSDPIIVWGGTVNAALYPPYSDLSKANLTWVVDADTHDILDVTIMMALFTGDGDITWILQDLVDGKTPVRTYGDVRARAELDRQRQVVSVTFTPR